MSDIYQSSDNAPPPDPASSTPNAVVDQNPSVGTSENYAREDHTHLGVPWVTKQSSSLIRGGVYFQDTATVTWSMAEGFPLGGFPGHCAVMSATAVGTIAASSAPPNVASASATGSQSDYARSDHTHGGVTSLNAGSGNITGALTLAAGSNISLVQAGSTVTIAGTGVSSIDAGGGAISGPITLSAGTNIAISQVGSTITINSTGGGGGSTSWSERVWTAVSWTANITLDTATATGFAVVMGGNTTLLTPTGAVAYKSIILRLTQDGTGSRTLSFNSGWNISNDLLGLTVSSSANATTYIGAIYNEQTLKWDVVSFARGY